MALLNCTAIVNTSNETLTDKNPVSDIIHQHAGPELREELLKLKGRGRHSQTHPGFSYVHLLLLASGTGTIGVRVGGDQVYHHVGLGVELRFMLGKTQPINMRIIYL